jgi:hypothetical protein
MAISETQALQALHARRATGIPDLGAEVRQRISELGAMDLSTAARRDAFAEVIAAHDVTPYVLLLDPNESSVDPVGSLLHLKGALVEPRAAQRPVVVAIVERLLDLEGGIADHMYLAVESGFRNGGVAPRLMLQAFELYDRLGIRHVRVHAGLQSGRYYWAARVGYEFADETQRRHVERWAAFVLGAVGAEHDLGGVEDPQQWALLGTEVEPELTISLDDLAEALPNTLPEVLLDPNGTGVVGFVDAAAVAAGGGMVDATAHLANVRDGNGLTGESGIPLGKAIMLTGPDWYGVFDLSDPVRRGEFEHEARARLLRAGIQYP